jgi:hypothetical protein
MDVKGEKKTTDKRMEVTNTLERDGSKKEERKKEWKEIRKKKNIHRE